MQKCGFGILIILFIVNCLGVIGLAIGVFPLQEPVQVSVETFSAIPRPDVPSFRWNPQPDITAYELALSMPAMFGNIDFIEQMRKQYDVMPPEAKRHWLPPKPKE